MNNIVPRVTRNGFLCCRVWPPMLSKKGNGLRTIFRSTWSVLSILSYTYTIEGPL